MENPQSGRGACPRCSWRMEAFDQNNNKSGGKPPFLTASCLIELINR